MEWCDLNPKGKYRFEELKQLENEITYMKKMGYLGDWFNNSGSQLPSISDNPFECTITLTAPDWLKEEIKLIEEKRDNIRSIKKTNPLSITDFSSVLKESGLTTTQFAQAINVTPQLISSIISGKRKISHETTNKINAFINQRNGMKQNPWLSLET